MTIIFEERLSDSLYIESIQRGRTASAGTKIRPAASQWHMVLVRVHGRTQLFVVGPWTKSGIVSYGEGAELLWIKFKLGAFMPHLPTCDFRDSETILPEAASSSFWLNGSAWQFPDYDNVETFIDRLARRGVLAHDLVVKEVLQGTSQGEISPRTVRYRFLRATGLTHSHIEQIERAQRAAALLEQGFSILDTTFDAGYFDQPHLTRSLKQYMGYTPAQIVQMSQEACRSVQDSDLLPSYNTNVLAELR
jgi:AraC-like DNA-binding protein